MIFHIKTGKKKMVFFGTDIRDNLLEKVFQEIDKDNFHIEGMSFKNPKDSILKTKNIFYKQRCQFWDGRFASIYAAVKQFGEKKGAGVCELEEFQMSHIRKLQGMEISLYCTRALKAYEIDIDPAVICSEKGESNMLAYNVTVHKVKV